MCTLTWNRTEKLFFEVNEKCLNNKSDDAVSLMDKQTPVLNDKHVVFLAVFSQLMGHKTIT